MAMAMFNGSDLDSREHIRINRQIEGENIDVIYMKSDRNLTYGEWRAQCVEAEAKGETPPMRPLHGFVPPFHQRVYEPEPGILCEQEVPVLLRDGTKIYCDIYRPRDAKDIPVIVSWSIFGKRPAADTPEFPILGVPPTAVSTMAKFESPDPAFWCRQGYAVANVDSRGVGHNEGEILQFGSQDGRDGYDFVEWIARQWWCNGKVGLAGNSGVAMTHWWIAAEQPPHLCCIAPWEATADIYRESVCEGGIPAGGFVGWILSILKGENYTEDTVSMLKEHPFMDAYWRDKTPHFEKISVPAYLTAGWSHFHLRGAMNGWRKIGSKEKWLRVHREFEWPDTYSPFGLDDLKRFYDRYLKDVRNGWELTPRVRMDVMDAFDCDYQLKRPENEFPLKRTEYRKLFLDAKDMSMSWRSSPVEAACSHDAESGKSEFIFTFTDDTELTGYMALRLWVEARGHDDMDMFIAVQKLSTKDEWLPWNVLGEAHPGAWGKMRVSRRELDPSLSEPWNPVQAHLRDQKLKPGEIVPVDIEIWPSSRIWHKGQKLRLVIGTRYEREGWFEPFKWDTDNHGEHVIHTGGQYDSWLMVPVIPPKYVDGDYVYR